MQIVINVKPESMCNITFFDGVGIQIYPPHNLWYQDIIPYIQDICDEHDINLINIIGPNTYIQRLKENLKVVFPTVKIV
jgi:hypothetical protein